MIGPHMQNTAPDWLTAVAALPANTPVKCVNDYFMARDAKRANPNIKTIFRHVADGEQHPSDNYDENLEKARHFFSTFIDGTWFEQEIYKYVDYIEEWNEYLANSMPVEEVSRWLSWNKAVQTVWAEMKATDSRLAGIRLVCCNTAVGNSIPWQFAQQTMTFGNVLGYHGYTHFEDGLRDPLDWQYHSGRWETMDADYRARGIYVDWLSTESGPYASVFAGWKDTRTVGGDMNRYLDECIAYQLDRITAWNATHNNRFKGAVLFTTSNDDQWERYNLNGSQLLTIAQFVATHAPGPIDPPPPPPVDDWQQAAWDENVRKQISNGIMLNTAAALQQKIFRDGFIPVQNEFSFDGKTYQAAETLDGSMPRRLYWWTAANGVDYFHEP